MPKITDVVAQLAREQVEAHGCTLWDVEYVREGGEWYLRLYIDKEGGVSINDCEAISRPVSDLLDEADPIEGSYVFEVSSAGLERALKKPEHFSQSLGKTVCVRFYRAIDGAKERIGVLENYEDGNVTVDGVTYEKKDVAAVRLHVSF